MVKHAFATVRIRRSMAGLCAFFWAACARPESHISDPPTPAPVSPRPASSASAPVSRDSVPFADLRKDLRYDVDVAVLDTLGWRLLRAGATVINISSRTVRLEHGACAVSLVAYRDSTRVASPAWDSRRSASWPTGSPYGCPDIGMGVELAPGESYRGGHDVGQLRALLPLGAIYGDSLPTGRYYFDAHLHLNDDTVRLQAGSAVLPTSRFSVGPEYPLDGFYYRVARETLPTRPRTYEIRVEIASAGDRPDLTRYVARECPIVLHAYTSKEAQHTAPPAPVWISPRRCAGTPAPIRPRSGEDRTLVRRFTAREVLGDSLRPGRYYVSAVVRFVDPPGSRLLNRRVWLDAGAFDLRRGSASGRQE